MLALVFQRLAIRMHGLDAGIHVYAKAVSESSSASGRQPASVAMSTFTPGTPRNADLVGRAARCPVVPDPFPRGLPPNRTGRFRASGSPVICAALAVMRPWMAPWQGVADDERLAPFPGHEGRPFGLACPRCSEAGACGLGELPPCPVVDTARTAV